eukprot:4296593-Karenia_brevis.AAC.1
MITQPGSMQSSTDNPSRGKLPPIKVLESLEQEIEEAEHAFYQCTSPQDQVRLIRAIISRRKSVLGDINAKLLQGQKQINQEQRKIQELKRQEAMLLLGTEER